MTVSTSRSTKGGGYTAARFGRIAPPWPVAILFLLVGVLAIAVGLHDLLAAPAQYQLNALFLLIVGLVPVLALVSSALGWGLAAAEPERGILLTPSLSSTGNAARALTAVLYLLTPVAVGGISVSMLTAALLTVDFRDGQSLMRIVPWFVIVLLTLWTVIRLWRRRSAITLGKDMGDVTSRWAKFSIWGIVGAALGAVSGLLPLWYGNDIRPFTAEPSINIQSNLHRVGHLPDGVTVVSGDITVRNQGEGSVTILGSMYELKGLVTTATDALPTYGNYKLALDNGYEPVLRPRVVNRRQIVAVGWVTPQAWYLLKGEEYRRTFVAYVPSMFDSAWMQVQVIEAKKSVLNVTNTAAAWGYTDGVAVKEEVEQVSWIDRITKPPLSVEAWWYLRGGGPYKSDKGTTNPTDVTLDLCLYVSSTCTYRPGFNVRYYGIVHESRVNELSLIKPDEALTSAANSG